MRRIIKFLGIAAGTAGVAGVDSNAVSSPLLSNHQTNALPDMQRTLTDDHSMSFHELCQQQHDDLQTLLTSSACNQQEDIILRVYDRNTQMMEHLKHKNAFAEMHDNAQNIGSAVKEITSPEMRKAFSQSSIALMGVTTTLLLATCGVCIRKMKQEKESSKKVQATYSESIGLVGKIFDDMSKGEVDFDTLASGMAIAEKMSKELEKEDNNVLNRMTNRAKNCIERFKAKPTEPEQHPLTTKTAEEPSNKRNILTIQEAVEKLRKQAKELESSAESEVGQGDISQSDHRISKAHEKLGRAVGKCKLAFALRTESPTIPLPDLASSSSHKESPPEDSHTSALRGAVHQVMQQRFAGGDRGLNMGRQ